MNIERTEIVLTTIDKLGAASVKQLHEILKFGSYRYMCQIVSKLEQYLNVDRSRQKIVYLNKEGRMFIGSNREVKKSPLLDHMLLTNDVFIHFNFPKTWEREYVIKIVQKQANFSFIKVEGLQLKNEIKIVCDAFFERNGYTYLIEIDNTRAMTDNRKKIQKYLSHWSELCKQFSNPRLCFFTKSEKRKREFLTLLKNIPHEVKTFNEL